MIPEEKAKHLIENFVKIQKDFGQANYYGQAKKSALFCVDEILETYLSLLTRKYWKEVKNEIESLNK